MNDDKISTISNRVDLLVVMCWGAFMGFGLVIVLISQFIIYSEIQSSRREMVIQFNYQNEVSSIKEK